MSSSNAAVAASYTASNSRRSTGEYFAAMLGPNQKGASNTTGVPVKRNGANRESNAKQQLQQQQQQSQQLCGMQRVPSSLKQEQQQQKHNTAHADQFPSAPASLQGKASGSTGGSTDRSISETQQSEVQPDAEQQQQKHGAAAPIDTRDPDAAVAAITATIAADIGETLVSGSRARPQLFIGDLLVGPTGSVLRTAEQQLAVISGLFQQWAGDLLEIYGYYALLGGSAQVVADR
jgi:hypothetical protein